jgi:hypothetical protein
MTAITVAHSDHASKVYSPYSQAMAVGNLVYTAGQIPLDPVSMGRGGGLAPWGSRRDRSGRRQVSERVQGRLVLTAWWT